VLADPLDVLPIALGYRNVVAALEFSSNCPQKLMHREEKTGSSRREIPVSFRKAFSWNKVGAVPPRIGRTQEIRAIPKITTDEKPRRMVLLL